MTIDVRAFEFFADPPREDALAGETTARLNSGVGGMLELLRSLAAQLSFPSYFGNNWDALEESLQDLLPNQGRALALVHETLPPDLTDSELRTYLEVLGRVILHRQEFGEPKLRALFSQEMRDRVERLASR